MHSLQYFSLNSQLYVLIHLAWKKDLNKKSLLPFSSYISFVRFLKYIPTYGIIEMDKSLN